MPSLPRRSGFSPRRLALSALPACLALPLLPPHVARPALPAGLALPARAAASFPLLPAELLFRILPFPILLQGAAMSRPPQARRCPLTCPPLPPHPYHLPPDFGI